MVTDKMTLPRILYNLATSTLGFNAFYLNATNGKSPVKKMAVYWSDFDTSLNLLLMFMSASSE